jgi:hypothetical protein
MTNKKRPTFLEAYPHLKDFTVFLEQLRKESERGEVMISASVLDDLLRKTVEAFLVVGGSAEKLLTGFNAPLGSFSSRIEAAHALGLISDEEFHDANVIRKIRNEFAHTLTTSFEDQNITDQCVTLYFSAKDYGDDVVGARGQFSTAATGLILNLTNRPSYVGKKRLEWQHWPY